MFLVTPVLLQWELVCFSTGIVFEGYLVYMDPHHLRKILLDNIQNIESSWIQTKSCNRQCIDALTSTVDAVIMQYQKLKICVARLLEDNPDYSKQTILQ